METLPPPGDDPILHFVLDGVLYACQQNQMTKEQLKDSLNKWFPDCDIIDEIPLAELPFDDGA